MGLLWWASALIGLCIGWERPGAEFNRAPETPLFVRRALGLVVVVGLAIEAIVRAPGPAGFIVALSLPLGLFTLGEIAGYWLRVLAIRVGLVK